MNSEEKNQLMKRLVFMYEYFGKEAKPEFLAFDAEALKDYPFDQVSKAISDAMQTATFPPRVAEIKQLLDPQKEDLQAIARQEWEKVRASTVRSTEHPALKEDAITSLLVHGNFNPKKIGQQSIEDLDNWVRREFISAYIDHAQSKDVKAHLAAGLGPDQRIGELANQFRPQLDQGV